MSEKEYSGSKISRLKAMVATGILSASILASPGMSHEAIAAGATHYHTESNKTMVIKPSKEKMSKILKGIEKMENQRQEMEKLNNTNKRSNSFRDNLRIDNPNSEYYTPDYNNNYSSKNITNSNIKGNVKIGEIDDDRGRW